LDVWPLDTEAEQCEPLLHWESAHKVLSVVVRYIVNPKESTRDLVARWLVFTAKPLHLSAQGSPRMRRALGPQPTRIVYPNGVESIATNAMTKPIQGIEERRGLTFPGYVAKPTNPGLKD
jgi:hypothetical protein